MTGTGTSLCSDPVPFFCNFLAQNLADGVAAAEGSDELQWSTVGASKFRRSADADGFVEGRKEVRDIDRSVGDFCSVVAHGADDLASLDLPATQNNGPPSRPMIPARILIDLRRASEIPHAANRGGS